MTYSSKRRWAEYLVLGLTVFLVFCLLFESHIEPPPPVSWLGKWHPVLLHFPIVLLIVAILINLFGTKVPPVLLTASCLAALITAITGFLLGLSSEGKGNLLFWHQWLGVSVAITATLWYWLDNKGYGSHLMVKVLNVGLLFLIGFAGHYGGMITHGENFLAFQGRKQPEKIPENPLIYEHVVGRILDNHCVKCHNPNKTKGQLVMTGLDELLKGGESGSTLVPGAPEKSEIIRRLYLPVEDEDHMPPEGEAALSGDEIRILERWIALGASDTLRLNHLETTDPLANLIKDMMEPDPLEKWAKLPFVADSTLKRLSSDYLTITRLAGSTNALRIAMYPPPEYKAKTILGLRPIADNVVELDFSGLPIGVRELAVVSTFGNLEWLEIDRTPITDAEIDTLKILSNLRLLKAYETNIGDKSIELFRNWKNLQKLYVWQTKISSEALEELKAENPDLLIEDGIDEELESYFAITDSIPKT